MGAFSMDMSRHEIERGEAMASDYGDEVLCAGGDLCPDFFRLLFSHRSIRLRFHGRGRVERQS